MKGIQGVVIALVLGLMGAGVNVWYLTKKGAVGENDLRFLIVRPDKKVKQGEIIKKDQLDYFSIPKDHAGNLIKIAYTTDSEGTITGQKCTRDLEGGELIRREDFRTATKTEAMPLEENEVAVPVPVDTRRFIASLVVPGRTRVSFRLPNTAPTPARSAEPAPLPGELLEQVGPFNVLAVGNRLGTVESMKNDNLRPSQEGVLTLRVSTTNGKMDPRVVRVLEYLARTNYQPLEVIIHPEIKPERKE